MSTYIVKNVEFQLRLEPIVSLRENYIVGFEALSRITKTTESGAFDYEEFFRALKLADYLYVIERQLEIYQKWTIQHPEIYGCKFLFINVHPSVLEDSEASECFIPFLRYFSIALEVDSHLSVMSDSARTNVAKLKKLGAQFWIDDFTGYGNIKGTFWNGVKIDRLAFQNGFKRFMAGGRASSYSNVLNIGPLVVEGIESESHLMHAVGLGASYGQGYLWAAHQREMLLSN